MPVCPTCGGPLTREEASGALCPSCNKPIFDEDRDEQRDRSRRPMRDRDREAPPISRDLVRQFRTQAHALGALWIIIGTAAVAVAGLAFQGNAFLANNLGGSTQILLGIVASMGALWFALGLLTCLKQIWAVYIGLVLSYLSLLGQVVNFNICGCIIVILMILQAHRVIGWAKKMRAAGFPMTTKPE